MTTTLAVLASLYQELSVNKTFLNNLSLADGKDGRDLIRNVRRKRLGLTTNDLAQGQAEALQILLLRYSNDTSAINKADYIERNSTTSAWQIAKEILQYSLSTTGSNNENDDINAAPTGASQMIIIKKQTLVNGVNVDNMNDDDVFSIIAQAETDIAQLNAIVNKPKKLEAKIAALQASIIELGILVDAR